MAKCRRETARLDCACDVAQASRKDLVQLYVTARKRFPKEGKTLRTALGLEKVVAVDIFRERVFLRNEEHGSRIIPLLQLREEVGRLREVKRARRDKQDMVRLH